jgi:predicted ATP-binding protein involved in virulence
MVISKDNIRLAIDQLSDGEKCYIAMIGDLARRMAVANPHAENSLNCGGIVLIDEVELHLHPEWRRRIVPSLRKIFPNIQFIITTYSPQVLGEIKDMDVIKLLKKDGNVIAQKALSVFGRDSSFILEEFMDTPEKNSEVSEKIGEMYRYINVKNYLAAERISQELSSDDADVVKARVLIARGKAKDETYRRE